MRRAFTLVEMLVVIAIVAVLFAIALPALQRARGAARATECRQRLRQIGLAIGMYHDDHDMFPGVNPRTSSRAGAGRSHGWSFHAGLLPYLEQSALYDQIDFRVTPDDLENATVRQHRIGVFLCPADRVSSEPRTNYVVSYGTWVHAKEFDGIHNPQWEKPIRRSAVRDGSAYTAAMSETLQGPGGGRLTNIFMSDAVERAGWDGAAAFRAACASVPSSAQIWRPSPKGGAWWASYVGVTSYNHVMPPNQPSCVFRDNPLPGGIAASSYHGGGVNVTMVDGSARFVSDRVDADTWWALGSIAGGEVVPQF